MKTLPFPDPSTRRKGSRAILRDPAAWAWLIVALLAILPARAALHVILV